MKNYIFTFLSLFISFEALSLEYKFKTNVEADLFILINQDEKSLGKTPYTYRVKNKTKVLEFKLKKKGYAPLKIIVIPNKSNTETVYIESNLELIDKYFDNNLDAIVSIKTHQEMNENINLINLLNSNRLTDALAKLNGLKPLSLSQKTILGNIHFLQKEYVKALEIYNEIIKELPKESKEYNEIFEIITKLKKDM